MERVLYYKIIFWSFCSKIRFSWSLYQWWFKGQVIGTERTKNATYFSCAEAVDYEVSTTRVSWKIGHVEKADARSHESHPLTHKAPAWAGLRGILTLSLRMSSRCPLEFTLLFSGRFCEQVWPKHHSLGKLLLIREMDSRCIKSILNLFAHRVTRRSKRIIPLASISSSRKCLNTFLTNWFCQIHEYIMSNLHLALIDTVNGHWK